MDLGVVRRVTMKPTQLLMVEHQLYARGHSQRQACMAPCPPHHLTQTMFGGILGRAKHETQVQVLWPNNKWGPSPPCEC